MDMKEMMAKALGLKEGEELKKGAKEVLTDAAYELLEQGRDALHEGLSDLPEDVQKHFWGAMELQYRQCQLDAMNNVRPMDFKFMGKR